VSFPGAGLLELTAELVDIPSVSHDEGRASDFVVRALAGAEHLAVSRIGHNVVARTSLGRTSRLLVAGHLDTVRRTATSAPSSKATVAPGLGQRT